MPFSWSNIGKALRRFHAQGVCHADLNAYNVQVDDDGELYLLDFDRGSLQSAGVWQQKNLARLHRSLQKIRKADERVQFSAAAWNALIEGYFKASRSA